MILSEMQKIMSLLLKDNQLTKIDQDEGIVLVLLVVGQDNFIQMKRQAFYLPNLNTILAQNRHLARHCLRLKQASSQYHQKSTPLLIEDRRQPSPFEKRQRRQQQCQNARMSKAMDNCIPTVKQVPKKQQQAYSSLKQRIRKFTTQGNSVTYKYEKSLLQFEKKRQNHEQFWSQRTRELHLKQTIEVNMPKYVTINHKAKASASQYSNDIFYKDADSLVLTDVKHRKMTLEPKRSLTPHNFIYRSGEGRGNTVKIKTKSRERVQTEGTNIQSHTGISDTQARTQERYYSELCGEINKSIKQTILSKISRTLNPQMKKRRKKTMMDLQIISIPPVN